VPGGKLLRLGGCAFEKQLPNPSIEGTWELEPV